MQKRIVAAGIVFLVFISFNLAFAQEAQPDALTAELVAAAGDPNKIAQIMERELTAANVDGLAVALAAAAETLASCY